MTDLYQTISSPSEGVYKEKGSKFIAMAYPIFSESEFKEKMQDLKKEYHDARHHCYAFRLGADMQQYRFSDDGEPSSTAGKPIFGQIQSFKLTNIAIIVMRYFGGTKLGVGGLITAYKAATKDALNNANVISRTVDNSYEIQFSYAIMSDVMNFLKKNSIEILSQSLEESGTIQIRVRKSESQRIIEQLEKIDGLKIEFIETI